MGVRYEFPDSKKAFSTVHHITQVLKDNSSYQDTEYKGYDIASEDIGGNDRHQKISISKRGDASRKNTVVIEYDARATMPKGNSPFIAVVSGNSMYQELIEKLVSGISQEYENGGVPAANQLAAAG